MGLIRNFDLLASTPARRTVLEIVESGLEAIQPENVLDAGCRIQDSRMEIREKKLEIGNYNRIFLVGFGKGSAVISSIIENKLEDRLTAGWVIDTEKIKNQKPLRPHSGQAKIKSFLGTHPLPSQQNIDFTREMLRSLSKLSDRDLVLVVVCGGGSVMLTDPVVSLEELIKANKQLLKSGKTITEMNAERKKIDRVKGGGLAKLLSPAQVVGLIFSDVPGNDLSVIASGPTVSEEELSNVENVLMLSNLTALEAMKKKAEELGYITEIYSDKMQGEARKMGKELINKINKQSLRSSPAMSDAGLKISNNKGVVLLAGGETTVTVTGNGKGGRNQELVLGALREMNNEQSAMNNLVICSVDSDGWDNCEVAGAIGDRLKLDPAKFLENNDVYSYFQKTGDFVETGRLPSNVADLVLVLKYD